VALDQHALEASAAFARPTPATDRPGAELVVTRTWDGSRFRSTLTNTGDVSVRVEEVVVASGGHGLPTDTPLYGEGFTMLSQYEGTIAALTLLGGYGDATHYRLPQRAGFRTVYDLALVSPAGGPHTLVAFASSRRFAGQLRFSDTAYELALDTEGLELAPGATWELEDVVVFTGPDPDALFADLATELSRVHPPRVPAERLTGWCSWYCFGPDVTEADIVANLHAADEHGLGLTYVQIDDGYQARMGDWPDPGPLVPGPAGLCRTITQLGHEPAIWVAPFIAEAGSTVLREHPEWFVSDESGLPLASDRISYGGWRRGPWFMLDGSNPEARDHLRSVFSTMRNDWGCRYFKLDANVWGALPGGHRLGPGGHPRRELPARDGGDPGRGRRRVDHPGLQRAELGVVGVGRRDADDRRHLPHARGGRLGCEGRAAPVVAEQPVVDRGSGLPGGDGVEADGGAARVPRRLHP